MKKARKLWVAAVAMITAVLMIGCGNALTGVTVDGNSSSRNSNKVTLSAVISNYYDFNAPEESNAGRSILPPTRDKANGGSALEYDYYLYGTTGKNTLELTKVTDKISSGSFSYEVDSGAWEFTLYAIEKGATAPTTTTAALEASYLVAYAFCDLTSANNTATFTLSSDTLNGKGTIKLKCYLSDDAGTTTWYSSLPTGHTVSVVMRNLKTNEEVTGTNKDLTFAATNIGVDGVPYEVSSCDPGTYNFIVDIKDSGGKILQTWSDTITVVTKRETSGKVFIPNLVGVKPDKVAGLTATYLSGSEDLPSHRGQYKVQFTWTNTPVNETHYELQVAEISKAPATKSTITTYDFTNVANTKINVYTPDGTVPEDERTGGDHVLPDNATVKKLFDNTNSPEYVFGSLNRNNEKVVLSLELGKRYTARIRAVNDLGASEWTNLKLTDGSGDSNVLTTAHNTYKASVRDSTAQTDFDNDFVTAQITAACLVDGSTGTGTTAYFKDEDDVLTDAINRFRITYHLNGGSYTESDNTEAVFDRNVYYTVQSGATAATPTNDGYELWDGSSLAPTGGHALKNVDKELQEWALEEYFKVIPHDTTKVVWTKPIYEEATGNYDNTKEYYTKSGSTYTKVTDHTGWTNGATLPAGGPYYLLKNAPDNKPYQGFANYDVYAVYSGSKHTGTFTVTEATDLAKYVLLAKWFDIGSTAIISDDTVVSMAKTLTYTNRASAITFGVTIPDTIPTMYDSITMTIKKVAGNEIMIIETVDSSVWTPGQRKNFTGVDMKDWDNGKYTVEWVAKKNVAGVTDTIVRKVNLALTLTDD